MIYVKQINLHHCKGATALVSNHMQLMHTHNKQSIVLIQEPWIKNNLIQGLNTNEKNIYYAQKPASRPRSCIVTSKNIETDLLIQYCTNDITAIKIKLKYDNTSEETIICSVHMQHELNEAVPQSAVRKLIEYSNSSGIPIIIGADCNSHHTLWGSTNINSRGEKLVEFLGTTNLEIINNGNKPTFMNKNRSEVIDITLATQNIAHRLKGWHVSPEETLSDHKEIIFSIESEQNLNKLFRNPRKTD